MFETISGATPAVPFRGAGPAIPAVPAVPPGHSRTDAHDDDVLDAIEQARAEVENDVDYQILRQTLRFMRESTEDDSRPVATAKAETPPGESPERSPEVRETATGTEGVSLDFEQTVTTVVRVDIEGRDENGEFRVRFEAIRSESTTLSVRANQQAQKSDPLILDLDGDGIETSGIDRGVLFDITGDGRSEWTSFVTGGDAFLALDRNGNGAIDDGRELFGDQHGAANGFAELAKFDDNRDGRIDANDGVFAQLRLFSLNADGSQNLRRLTEAGIAAIDLGHADKVVGLNRDDDLAQIGSYERTDGSTGQAGDVLLGYRAVA